MGATGVSFFVFMNDYINIEIEYYVKDLYEASFLYASGINLLRLERDKANYYFIFSDRHQCEKLRDLYWSYNASINAKKLVDSIKSLKERLFSNER